MGENSVVYIKIKIRDVSSLFVLALGIYIYIIKRCDIYSLPRTRKQTGDSMSNLYIDVACDFSRSI